MRKMSASFAKLDVLKEFKIYGLSYHVTKNVFANKALQYLS